MLKNTWKIMTLAVLLLTISGWAMAGNLEPPGGPAPTMKTLQEIYDKVAIGTEIKSVPYEISSPGFYYLTQNLSSQFQNGISIAANNVTLDLMGFTLSGPVLAGGDNHGIYMNGRTNVEIRNGTVRSFPSYGIVEDSPDGRGHRIINIRAVGNGTSGIFLRSPGNQIKGCTASSNQHFGISVGIGSTVTGNTAYGNGRTGIEGGHGSTVTGNTANGNGWSGIVGRYGSTVTGNTVYNNVSNGITSLGRSTAIGNTAYENGNDGLNMTVSGSTVTSNNAYGNGRNGITSGSGSAVIGNTATHNQNYGIELGGYNLVDQNMVIDNNFSNMNSCPSCVFGTNLSPL